MAKTDSHSFLVANLCRVFIPPRYVCLPLGHVCLSLCRICIPSRRFFCSLRLEADKELAVQNLLPRSLPMHGVAK